LVVDVPRDDDTAQLAAQEEVNDAPAPGEPVGKVNLPDEPEFDAEYDYVAGSDAGYGIVEAAPSDRMIEKVAFGLLTVVLMILAMVVILQGVFEQKMPI
jgi:hypothetical protein